MTERRKFAVFDIDGTIIRWQLFHATVDELVKMGHFEPDFFDDIRAARMNWKQRAHEDAFDEYEGLMIRKFDAELAGMPVGTVLSAYKNVIAKYKDQAHTYTRDLIKQLKREGYLIFAVSASPKELVGMVAKYYGIDDYAGTVLETNEGQYTGKVDPVLAKRKVEMIMQLMAKHNVTPEGSIGVGDSEGDIPMLNFVNHPIAFNPTKKLYLRAKERGWRIVIERKNMVYEIEPQDGHYVLAKTNAD